MSKTTHNSTVANKTRQVWTVTIKSQIPIVSGQEAVKTYLTPEGVPTDSPKNITTRFQTPDVIEISYDAPPEESQNGQVRILSNCYVFWQAFVWCAHSKADHQPNTGWLPAGVPKFCLFGGFSNFKEYLKTLFSNIFLVWGWKITEKHRKLLKIAKKYISTSFGVHEAPVVGW